MALVHDCLGWNMEVLLRSWLAMCADKGWHVIDALCTNILRSTCLTRVSNLRLYTECFEGGLVNQAHLQRSNF